MKVILVPLTDRKPRLIDDDKATTELTNLCLRIVASGETDCSAPTLCRQIIDLYPGDGVFEGNLAAYDTTIVLFRRSRDLERIHAESFARKASHVTA